MCPVGFCDFSIPIVLPDGQILGRVLAGQALSVNQKEEEIIQKTPANQDRVLSQITQIMYSYNPTLNLISGKYSLIVGTGMEAFVKIFESTLIISAVCLRLGNERIKRDISAIWNMRQRQKNVTKGAAVAAPFMIIVWKFFWSVVQRYRRLPEEDKATSVYPYPHLLFQEKHRSVQQM